MYNFAKELLLGKVVKTFGDGRPVDYRILESYIKEAVAKSVVQSNKRA